MIKYRQKIFFAPLAALAASKTAMGAMNLGILGTSAWGLKQAHDASKQSDQQAEAMAEQNREITKALNRVAKNAAKNPQAATEAANIVGQKQFAFIKPGMLNGLKSFGKDLFNKNNLKGFGKDLKNIAGPGVSNFAKKGIISGMALGGTSYVANKLIEKDAKKIGFPIQQPDQQKQYSVLSGIGKAVKSVGKGTLNTIKNNKFEIGSMAAFGAMPALGYISERQQFKDQIANTNTPKSLSSNYYPAQKQYAIPNLSILKGVGRTVKGWGKSAKSGWDTFKSHPAQSTLGGISNMTSFGNLGSKELFGTKGKLGFAQKLQKSSNPISNRLGNFMMNNKKTTLIGAIGAGTAGVAGTYNLGEDLVRKGAKAVDKNAFAYEESRN